MTEDSGIDLDTAFDILALAFLFCLFAGTIAKALAF